MTQLQDVRKFIKDSGESISAVAKLLEEIQGLEKAAGGPELLRKAVAFWSTVESEK